ncbi:MAG: hypothetical protein PUD60_00115 [Akkermansia muciniphila]|nr:hypothetical protein [Akkermansia muciniphila]
MNEIIRRESEMDLVRPDGYFLLDLEPLVQKHPDKFWRRLKVPELMLWNDKSVVVLEAKKSFPRKQKKECPDDLVKRASDCGFVLVPRLDHWCEDLREKYITALLLMRPDVMKRFLAASVDPDPEKSDDLRNGCLLKAGIVKLVLLVKGVPEEFIHALQDELRPKIEEKLKSWQPNCAFRVLNEEMAVRSGFVVPC